MKKYFRVMVGLATLAAAAHFGCSFAQPRVQLPVLPEHDALFSSTRFVSSLALDKNGALWASTSGGVLRRSSDGTWKKFTRLDGLPATEARKVSVNAEGEIEVLLPHSIATWRDDKWTVSKADAPPNAPQAIDVEWNGSMVQASPKVLRKRPKNSMAWTDITLPKSPATHVSALLARDKALWCALYGDGLWSYDGENWQKLDIALPADAKQATALTFDEDTKTLWVGTRRDGIWQYSLGGWRQHLQQDEPFDHNAQFLKMYSGELWMSTLDDGLQARGEDGWRYYDGKVLSSDAPRHLVEYQNRLYVRHGNGMVDCFDGKKWSLDIWKQELPRRKAFALATDGQKIYAAQWGGWSEWDGKTWQHFLQVPELQGLPLMCLLPDGKRLWIGTQSKGVGEYSYTIKTLKWHDERAGLQDDWITSLAKINSEVFAGTFVGGLSIWNGKTWRNVKQVEGDNVTDVIADPNEGALIATRRGVWRRTREGVMHKLNEKHSWLDSETQAVCVTNQGAWIGARTGLFWLSGTSPNTY